jgi:hypothetical protein
MHVCMDVWTYGCMDVWLYGYMDVWMDGWVHVCMHASSTKKTHPYTSLAGSSAQL